MALSYNKVMEWLDNVVDTIFTHKRQALYGLAGVATLALGVTGYMYYREHVQAKAHKEFIEALRYYDAPVTGKKTVMVGDTMEFATEDEKWKKVEEVFKQGYDNNRSSGISSIFKAYQANALAQLGMLDMAIDTMTSAISSIPDKSVKDFYSLKLALMKLDSLQQAVQQEGFVSLKKIAEDEQGYAHEAGLYYIGYYFWTQKDYAQVRNYWQQYMVKYGLKDLKQQSGFADSVRSKLKLVSAEW
jgi:tetratricopeptide (TPR) repeat protein